MKDNKTNAMERLRVSAPALILFLILPFITVLAQDGSPSTDSFKRDSIQLDEVVVSTFKQTSDYSTLPIAASKISSTDLIQRNITNIKDITSIIPNLFILEYGSKKISPIYIRGIGNNKDMPSVGLYVDGVPYFDRSTFDLNINDIDHIEVLRGPQGTIYGRNTMGGVINIHTRSPLTYQGTNITLGAGNHNNYNAQLSHYGKISSNLGYSIAGKYEHSGGYFNNITTEKKADPSDEVGVRFKLSWKAAPNLLIQLNSNYEYLDQDGYPYRVYHVDTKVVDPINYNRTSYFKRNISTTGLTVSYFTEYFKLSSQTSFQYYDAKQSLDQDFKPQDLFYVLFDQKQQMISQEFNIKSTQETKYQWQFGAFGFHQNYKQLTDIQFIPNDSIVLQDVKNPTSGLAVYHQSTINDLIFPGLSVNAGIRYDWERVKGRTHNTRTVRKGEPLYEAGEWEKETFSQVTPKVSIQYANPEAGLTYFSVSRGYKTGGFNNLAEDPKDYSYDPEHSWCYELGYKGSFWNSLLELDVALFYIDWRDQQVSQRKVTGRGFTIRNAGKSVSKGVEVTARIAPFKNFNAEIAYGYTHAKYKDFFVSETEIYDKHFMQMVPRNTLSVAANYTWEIRRCPVLDRINFHAQYNGVGKLYWDEPNKIDEPYYGVFNGRVSFEKEALSLAFWMKNIGSEEYKAYHFTSGPTHYVQMSKPFTCGVAVSYSF